MTAWPTGTAPVQVTVLEWASYLPEPASGGPESSEPGTKAASSATSLRSSVNRKRRASPEPVLSRVAVSARVPSGSVAAVVRMWTRGPPTVTLARQTGRQWASVAVAGTRTAAEAVSSPLTDGGTVPVSV